MYIQHISIYNLGAIQFYEAEFTPELNLIDSRYTAEISAVLAYLMCSHTSQEIPERWLREDTHILAKVTMADTHYMLRAIPEQGRLRLSVTDPAGGDATDFYRRTLSHCPEQDAVEIFDGQDETIPLRLCRYRYREDESDLSVNTQRIADTKTFRQFWTQYIKDFHPEPINGQKKYRVIIETTGKFAVIYPGVSGKVSLSETDQKLFWYICFLNIAEFWEDIERIRDLHHERKTLLIQSFLEYLDESVDIEGLLARTLQFRRQVMILTPPMREEIKKKWTGDHNER